MEFTRRSITNVAAAGPARLRWASSPSSAAIPRPTITALPRRTRTRCTPRRFWTYRASRTSSSFPIHTPPLSLMPMLSGWTDVFQVLPGKHTTGTGAQAYLITGPRWNGSVPAGLKQLKSSATGIVWLFAPDLLHGHAGGLCGRARDEDPIVLEPLSALGKTYHAAGEHRQSSLAVDVCRYAISCRAVAGTSTSRCWRS